MKGKKIYKKAMDFQKEENYLASRLELEKLLTAYSDPEIYWVLGLTEIKLGNLKQAQYYLNKIEGDVFPKLGMLKRLLEGNMARYDAACILFTEAVKMVKASEDEKAMGTLSKLLVMYGDLPLPLDIYKTQFLLTLKNSMVDGLLYFESLPSYIQKSFDFSFNDALGLSVVSKKHKKSGKLKWIFPVFVVMFLGAVGAWGFTQNPEFKSFFKYEKQPVSKKQPVSEKKSIENTDKEPVEKEEEPSIEEPAPKIPGDHKSYEEGYALYKKRKYDKALPYFEAIINRKSQDYYTDDAHYYLILSMAKLNRLEDSLTQSKHFLNKEGASYKESTLKYAVMINQGYCLEKLGKVEEAIKIYKKVKKAPVKDWEVLEANNRLQILQK